MLDRPESYLTPVELDDVSIIKASGLFDESWYYANNPDVAVTRICGVVHYVKNGAREGRNPTGLFDTNRYCSLKASELAPGQNPFAYYILHELPDRLFNRGMLPSFSSATLRAAIKRLAALPIYSDEGYLKLNSDLVASKVVPAEHAFVYGFPEGRAIFEKAAVSRVLGRLARSGEDAPAQLPADTAAPPSASVGVYYNSRGNGFIREIAADLVASLTASGVDTKLANEESDINDLPDTCVFVAPHEFFQLGSGPDWAHDDIIRRSLMFNTEQPQTLWFERGMPFVLMSRGVIDISGQLAALFAETGMPALHFTPAVVRTSDPLVRTDMKHAMVRVLPRRAREQSRPETPFTERPIDISFFGGASAHRDAFFVRHARFLADYECYLYYRRFEGPHTDCERDGILSRLGAHVTAHSKIALNIHRDDYGFFEWHRIVKLGMAGGSVVVSEPCLPHPLYKPGIHFFEESGRHMPDLLDWLLKSNDGRVRAEEVRQAATAAVHDADVIARNHARLRAFVTKHGMAGP